MRPIEWRAMLQSKRLELANDIMQILAKRNRDNPKLTDYELLHIIRNEGDNTMQLSTIHDAVTYLEDMEAVNVDRFMGTIPPDFDHVKLSKKGMAKLYENSDWPKPARGPIPIYHCKKCDAIIKPTDEKCPNGHDLSIVGKMIKLNLKEGLTLSDSVSLTSGFVINKIGNIVKGLELEPITPENQIKIDELNEISELLKEQKATLSRIVAQTSPPTFLQRFQENAMDYFITLVIGGGAVGLWLWFAG